MTTDARRLLQNILNERPAERHELEAIFGKDDVFNTEQLQVAFEVRSFLAPFVFVTRKRDGAKGTLVFQHHPRFYFNWDANG